MFMRKLLVLTVGLLISTGTATAQASSNTSKTHDLASIIKWEKHQIVVQKQIVHEKSVWRILTNTATYSTAIVIPLAEHQLKLHQSYLHKLQVRLAANVKEYKKQHAFHGSPRLSAWICIHNYEGAWNANTGNGYYGGLQMDLGFQSTYGPELLKSKGTANNWSPSEQIMVADRAYESGRGFGPWPNTAHYCGLF